MKLRLEKGSVKVRLATEEIEQLRIEKSIQEHLFFSKDSKFSFSVGIKSDIENIAVNFVANNLQITIPEHVSDKWMSSNQVGLKRIIEADNGESMEIVVEEDLPPRKMKQESRK